MSILFILTAIVTGILILEVEILIVVILNFLAHDTSIFLEVLINLVICGFLAIIVLSQIKTHITLWSLMVLAGRDITAPQEVGDKIEVINGAKWMIKEQFKSIWYVINFGKINAEKN